MTIKPLLTLLLLFFCANVFSQTIYEIKYEFKANTTSPNYTAFLVRYGNGTGFMRVRYNNTTTGKDLVVEMAFDEILQKSSPSAAEYDELEFKGKNPKMIMGTSTYNPDYIWFQKKAGDEYFRPWGVTSPTKNNTVDQGKITTVKLLNSADLTTSYVNLFFGTDDPFYVNLFKQQTGNVASNSSINFYLINVANTEDPSIGNSCNVDRRRIKSEFSDLCEFLGFNFVYKEVSGTGFNKTAVQRAVSDLSPSSNDIVVFCYSGHGFRYSNATNEYPQLDLRYNRYDDINENTLNIADIYNQIKGKNARLNIVLSDCCNADIGLSRTIGINFAQTQKSSLGWDRNNCASLFLNTKASIIVSAAKRNQVAYCNSDIGGYFIYSFFSSLEKKFSKTFYGNADWESLITEAQSNTADLSQRNQCGYTSCRQDPIYWVGNN